MSTRFYVHVYTINVNRETVEEKKIVMVFFM